MTDEIILETRLAAAQFTVKALRAIVAKQGKSNASLRGANTVLREKKSKGWRQEWPRTAEFSINT